MGRVRPAMGGGARRVQRVLLTRINLAATGGRRVWTRDSVGAGSGGVGAR